MPRRISTVVHELLGPDWKETTVWFEDQGDHIEVRLSSPHFGWSGRLTYGEWHRLMLLGTNYLGQSPRVRDLHALRAGSDS